MAMGDLDQCFDDLEGWYFGKYWVTKGAIGCSIGDGERGGNLLAKDLVEESEVHVESSYWIHTLSGNGWVAGEMRALGYDIGEEMVL